MEVVCSAVAPYNGGMHTAETRYSFFQLDCLWSQQLLKLLVAIFPIYG